ncbi:MAG: hypothetical protein WCN99_02080 [bacterium]
MTRSTELERVILQTLEEAGITGPPVILEHVLEHLGLSIFWDYKQAADRKTYLFPDPKGNGGWRIRLSPLLPRQRVPFDLAHECVEFLAMRRGIEGPHWQINRAAAELLLPTAWVEEVMARDGFDLFAVARAFSSATFDTCALKMLLLGPKPCILTVSGNGRWRAFSPGTKRQKLTPTEQEFLDLSFTSPFPQKGYIGGLHLHAFPIPDRRGLRIEKVFLFTFPEV